MTTQVILLRDIAEAEAAVLTECVALKAEVERLATLLEGRDKFIADHDLWGEFVASLP